MHKQKWMQIYELFLSQQPKWVMDVMTMPTFIKTPVLIGLSLLSSLSLNIQAKPNYSAFAEQSRTTAKSLLSDKRLIADTHSISVEPALGVPNFLWLKPGANPSLSSAKSASNNLEAIARGHIAHYAKLYRLTTASLSSARLQDQQRLGDSTLVRFAQVINGIDVFERHINVLMDKQLALTAISGYLAPHQNINTAVANIAFKLSLPEAISSALADLSDQALAASALQLSEQRGEYQWYVLTDRAQAKLKFKLSQAVRGKKVYYPLAERLEPAYYLEITTADQDETDSDSAYSYVISAQDGRLLARTDLTAHDAHQPFSYRVWAEQATLPLPDDSPYGNDLTPFPEIAPTQAATPIAANLIQLSCGPISTCDPWLPDTAVQTVGNNVDAYADISRGDGFSLHDLRAPLSADHTFDYAYDFNEYDSDNRPGQLYPVIVQAFYTTNFLHDWLYDHGFNEQAGNGQDQNYGRGGPKSIG
ncbi:M36 family metallopeptidase [Methylocucumis oryzae]|uniref:M36 family metallopeptidase n=1 Tax=Methylocucumis oryzae TaxID=1632867 RepID=UPI000695EC82|nr:M36 family metallopeptidase [Methylocucumis oryzae]